jgi:hypothetical protein
MCQPMLTLCYVQIDVLLHALVLQLAYRFCNRNQLKNPGSVEKTGNERSKRNAPAWHYVKAL